MRSEKALAMVTAVACVLGSAQALARRSDASEKPGRVITSTDRYDALYARYLEATRAAGEAQAGSNWVNTLMSDPRAHAVNDLLTVNVVESIVAAGSADSNLNKAASGSASISKFFGLEKVLPESLDPTNLAGTASDTKFKGGGATNRTGTLTTNVTVRVAEVLPNGNLVLEGVREIDINGDRQIVVLTGIVRQADIQPGNVVASTSIGQLSVRYFGRGLIRDSLSPGWLIRVLNKIF